MLFGKTIREVILENTPNQNTPINRKSHEESDDYRVKPSLQPSSKPTFLDTPYAERAHGTEQKKWPDDMRMPPRGKGKGGRSRFQEEANSFQHDDYDNPRGGKGSRWKGFQDDELEGGKGSRINKYREDDKMIATFTKLFEKEFKWDGQATTYRQFMLRFEDALECTSPILTKIMHSQVILPDDPKECLEWVKIRKGAAFWPKEGLLGGDLHPPMDFHKPKLIKFGLGAAPHSQFQ